MGPDSYDWYIEGIYLTQWLGGGELLPNLFVLRPPVFVLVCAFDYLLGGAGYVIGVVLGLCIFGTYSLCLILIERAQKITVTNALTQNTLLATKGSSQPLAESWAAPILAITLTIAPINFFTPFVYADRLASLISLLSVYFLVRWHEGGGRGMLLWATLAGSIAGLTQIYAVIPFGLALAFLTGIRLHNAKEHRYQTLREPLIATLILICLIMGLSHVWRSTIAHGFTPPYLSLIAFDGHMLRFYKHTWGFYLLPIALMVMLLGKPALAIFRSSYILQIALAISVTLMGLLLLYHWKEARFTYYFFPWLMIFLCALFAARNKWSAGIIVIMLLMYSALVPQNYWIPQPRTLELNLRQSWIGDFALAKPVDRGLEHCTKDCPSNNEFIAGSEGYTQTMMGIYLHLMHTQNKQEK